MPLRRYQSSDAEFLEELMIQSITELGSQYYTDQQIRAWLSKVPAAQKLDQFCSDGRHVIIPVDDLDRPLAFIDLEANGHIDHLYCSPKFARQGLASKIYSSVEHLGKELGMTRFYSEASDVALPFFRTKGFTVRSRREFEIGEVEIHNYSIEKNILISYLE